MRVVPRLAVLFWRRGGARQRATLALTAAGVATSVVLALLALSVSPALADRADRIAWRDPAQNVAGTRATADGALQRTTDDQVGGLPVSRIDLAPTGSAAAPVPPGLDRFPAPGEVFASPALAARLAAAPAAELADRYPGRLAGTIGAEALAHEDELVVVIGHAAGALVPTVAVAADDLAAGASPVAVSAVAKGDVVPIGGFVRYGTDDDLATYRVLAQMAAVLLVIPTLLLVGAAARLTAAQREQRLAALRLAGATPGAVVGLTALEILLAAAVGTAVGVVGYLLALPVAASVPLAGGRFSPSDLRLGLGALSAVALVVPLAAAGSAVVALRKVVVGPLGVTRRQRPRRPSLARFLVVPVAWLAFGTSALSMRDGGSSFGALLGLGAVIATLAVTGPWVTWTIGWLLSRLARRPATLIAGRRIGDDPKGAYRTVSGMVLAGLIAGFLFAVLPTLRSAELSGREAGYLSVTIRPERLTAVREAVTAADPTTSLGFEDPSGRPRAEPTSGGTGAAAPLDAAVVVRDLDRVDAVRTAIADADPSATVGSADQDGFVTQFLDDLGRASVVMALASLLMATAATAIGGASSILDQRVTLGRLRLVGTPVEVLQRARRWQTLIPLLTASTGAMAFGAVAGLVMMLAFGVGSARIRPPDGASMAALSAASLVAGTAVVALTRPLLVRVSRALPRG